MRVRTKFRTIYLYNSPETSWGRGENNIAGCLSPVLVCKRGHDVTKKKKASSWPTISDIIITVSIRQDRIELPLEKDPRRSGGPPDTPRRAIVLFNMRVSMSHLRMN